MGRDKADTAGCFIRQFYANVPLADLRAAAPERLYGTWLALTWAAWIILSHLHGTDWGQIRNTTSAGWLETSQNV